MSLEGGGSCIATYQPATKSVTDKFREFSGKRKNISKGLFRNIFFKLQELDSKDKLSKDKDRWLLGVFRKKLLHYKNFQKKLPIEYSGVLKEVFD